MSEKVRRMVLFVHAHIVVSYLHATTLGTRVACRLKRDMKLLPHIQQHNCAKALRTLSNVHCERKDLQYAHDPQLALLHNHEQHANTATLQTT